MKKLLFSIAAGMTIIAGIYACSKKDDSRFTGNDETALINRIATGAAAKNYQAAIIVYNSAMAKAILQTNKADYFFAQAARENDAVAMKQLLETSFTNGTALFGLYEAVLSATSVLVAEIRANNITDRVAMAASLGLKATRGSNEVLNSLNNCDDVYSTATDACYNTYATAIVNCATSETQALYEACWRGAWSRYQSCLTTAWNNFRNCKPVMIESDF
jgi:hypothetical protein